MNRLPLVLAAMALILTSCGGGNPEPSAQPTETVTETVTETPEPVTETPEPVTETVTETPEPVIEEVEVVPQACLDAIDTAEQVADVVAGFSNSASKYPPLIADAFEAGLAGGTGAQPVIDEVRSVNREVAAQTGKLRRLVGPLNKAKAECRAEAE